MSPHEQLTPDQLKMKDETLSEFQTAVIGLYRRELQARLAQEFAQAPMSTNVLAMTNRVKNALAGEFADLVEVLGV